MTHCIGLKEVLKFENMRNQFRFLQFDIDCNKFWHRWVPLDLEMPVGYPESRFGCFSANLFARLVLWDVICCCSCCVHRWCRLLTPVRIKNTPLSLCCINVPQISRFLGEFCIYEVTHTVLYLQYCTKVWLLWLLQPNFAELCVQCVVCTVYSSWMMK